MLNDVATCLVHHCHCYFFALFQSPSFKKNLMSLLQNADYIFLFRLNLQKSMLSQLATHIYGPYKNASKLLNDAYVWSMHLHHKFNPHTLPYLRIALTEGETSPAKLSRNHHHINSNFLDIEYYAISRSDIFLMIRHFLTLYY